MSVIDEFLANNQEYVKSFRSGSLPMPPAKKIALVVCMDARMDTFSMLGMKHGDAHIIRNAGGIVTDDVIRSLIISQRIQDTREIMLLHHTECGMLAINDDEFAQQLENETGEQLAFEMQGFTDLEENVRESISKIKNNPFLIYKDKVRGFIYDVRSGSLREVK